MIEALPCPDCGVAQPPSAAHCASCGRDFRLRPPPLSAPPPPPAWDRRAVMQGRPALRVLLAFLVVLLATVPFALFGDLGWQVLLIFDALILIAVGLCAAADPEGLKPSLRSSGGFWLLLAVPLAVAAALFGRLYGRLLESLEIGVGPDDPFVGWPGWTLFLSMVLVPAVAEEVAFRGIFLRTARIVLRPGWAQLATAAAFAGLHFAPALLPFHLGLGLMLGLLRTASGSLWPCMLLHAGNNAIAIGLLPAWPSL